MSFYSAIGYVSSANVSSSFPPCGGIPVSGWGEEGGSLSIWWYYIIRHTILRSTVLPIPEVAKIHKSPLPLQKFLEVVRVLESILSNLVQSFGFLVLDLTGSLLGWLHKTGVSCHLPSEGRVILSEFLHEDFVSGIVVEIPFGVDFVERQLIGSRSIDHLKTKIEGFFLFFLLHLGDSSQGEWWHLAFLSSNETLIKFFFLFFIGTFWKRLWEVNFAFFLISSSDHIFDVHQP